MYQYALAKNISFALLNCLQSILLGFYFIPPNNWKLNRMSIENWELRTENSEKESNKIKKFFSLNILLLTFFTFSSLLIYIYIFLLLLCSPWTCHCQVHHKYVSISLEKIEIEKVIKKKNKQTKRQKTSYWKT